MKVKQPNVPIKIELIPFFKKDSIVFDKSKHILRLSNNYYRCDLNCRGKCNEKEGQFKKENFEKTFSRFANKFKINIVGGEDIVRRLLKDTLIRMINEEDDYSNEDIMQTTVDVIKQEFKKKGKIKKSDLKDFEKALVRSNSIDSSVMLMAYISGVIRSLSLKDNSIGIGRDLALITKKVYISNRGEIMSIEFERWGWYILNYIDRISLNYLNNLKQQEVNILNQKDETSDLDITEAVDYFKEGDFENALNNNSTSYFYSIFSILQKMMKTVLGGDTEKIKLQTINLMQEFATNPALQLAFKLTPIIASKVKRIGKKGQRGNMDK
jgi:hypothetical protein